MKLVLEDGSEFSGRPFGHPSAVAGEVVFNTAMTGYVETLTDPSYRGQILVLTYPLVGNYGVPAPREAGAIDAPFESPAIQVQGLVVQQASVAPSHHAKARTLGQWLHEAQVPGIAGVDTRRLTRILREAGTMRGWVFPREMSLAQAKEQAKSTDMEKEVFRAVAPPSITEHGSGPLRILLVDCGAKDNIVRSLAGRGATVVRAPWHEDLRKAGASAHGIMIGNGPGDPRNLDALVEQVRGLMTDGSRPIFGICLGNQILARAAGANIFKLPYGHRSVNQPVQDLLTRRCYVTSQNHGYAVDEESLPEAWEPWFVNINDGTNEGIRHRTKPFFSVQFHPEARPGPEDTGFLFDEFLRAVGAESRR